LDDRDIYVGFSDLNRKIYKNILERIYR
jgi:hypothetical protein